MQGTLLRGDLELACLDFFMTGSIWSTWYMKIVRISFLLVAIETGLSSGRLFEYSQFTLLERPQNGLPY